MRAAGIALKANHGGRARVCVMPDRPLRILILERRPKTCAHSKAPRAEMQKTKKSNNHQTIIQINFLSARDYYFIFMNTYFYKTNTNYF